MVWYSMVFNILGQSPNQVMKLKSRTGTLVYYRTSTSTGLSNAPMQSLKKKKGLVLFFIFGCKNINFVDQRSSHGLWVLQKHKIWRLWVQSCYFFFSCIACSAKWVTCQCSHQYEVFLVPAIVIVLWNVMHMH